MTTNSDAIKSNLQGPKSASGDMGSVTEHSLKDQIEADKYLINKESLKKSNPLRLMKISPGSAVGGDR